MSPPIQKLTSLKLNLKTLQLLKNSTYIAKHLYIYDFSGKADWWHGSALARPQAFHT